VQDIHKIVVIIGLIILITGGVFTIIRNLRPNDTSIDALLTRMRQRFPDLTEEELLQRIERFSGLGGILGNLNLILIAIGGIITIVGVILQPGKKKVGFKMNY